MKLNKLAIGGGVLVLLLSLLVVGCKGIEGGDTESLTVDTNKEKRWQSSNTSTTEYVRYYKQFGSSNDVTEAVVEITAQHPDNGWSGFVFGLEKNAKDTSKSDFYVLGLRTRNGKVEYYLSKFEGVNPADVASNKAMSLTGEDEIVPVTTVPDGLGISATKPLKATIKFTLKVDESGNTYNLSAGPDANNIRSVGDPIPTEATGCGIGAYGQLTTAEKEGVAVVSDTTIKVLSSTPSNLRSAEEAE